VPTAPGNLAEHQILPEPAMTLLAAFTYTHSSFSALPLLFPCCCLPAFGILSLLAAAFWIWMIVDCATNEPSDPANSSTKTVWILVIVLAGWIGALIYFLVRRPERRRLYGK
jgi:hypothetical protein